ncbi:transcriptional regulator family: Fungal Specific TF [Purpureocillium lilacinum]|uniref:Transcriptional regulator family: Fungal Specific TF n=1 Tax=Purpureocillium lilacinum TaxID=33203 RepID=A0ABR0CBA4_PURLI|nr:transcriptional regulator family: Fungal Specific TF [Purpureocillium lilacinum]
MDISDLLVRHEKLVHLNDGSKENNRPRKLSSGTSNHKPSLSDGHVETESSGLHQVSARPLPPPPQHQQPAAPQQHYHHGPVTQNGAPGPNSHDPRGTPRSAACNLDVLSDAALATEVNSMPPMMGEMGQHHTGHVSIKGYAETVGNYAERSREDQQQQVMSTGFTPQTQPPQPTYDDYNLFLDDFSSAPHLLPPHFEPDHQMAVWSRTPTQMHPRGISRPPSQFPSRFASLAPDLRDVGESGPRLHEDPARAPSFRISAVDHNVIKNRIDEYSSVLPSDFVFPSRHTLTRFLEGYISGFHEHLPFLHLPSLTPSELAPELLLAILAVGAQYRFEFNRGYALWYAAKAVATEQIRRRHSSEVHALLPTAASYSPHSTRPSPSISYRHSFASAQSERPTTQDTHREPYSPNTPQARLETIQAVLLLFAVGLWGAKTILQDALSLQSTLAFLIREEGLSVETSQAVLTDWDAWIRLEGANRTKLIAYCFFNLCSTAYDMPPQLLTSELNLYLPLRSQLWRAETSWQWQELRQSTPIAEITVHEAFSRLFGRTSQGLPANLSALGHYVLIHALIQHVYLLKQTSFAAGSPYDVQRTLKPEDVEEVTQALRVWQTSFEHRHQLKAAESGHYMSADSLTGGSLTFNATALLRLAYIRLNTDIPPSRSLETRDSMLIASALSTTPMLLRSLRLHRAVFQAVHALSMLVKAGVNYVARAKSTEWSIQHSLCNFECALLLAKWLLTLAAITPSDPPVSPEERSLLETVRRMLDETEFAVPIDPSLSGPGASGGQGDMASSDSAKLRQLASAVVRLWAETFKGTHIFDLVKVMGASLDGYADLVDKPPGRSSMGRIASDGGVA